MYKNLFKLSGDKTISFVSSGFFRILIFAWFVVQAVYMALSTRLGISPDEFYHHSFIQLFAKNGWLPFIHDQTGYYQVGEAVHAPFFLYHYLLSLPYHLFSDSGHEVVMLRLINVLLGVASLYVVCRIANKLKVGSLVKNLSLFMTANTLMFVFLSGSMNYDNLFVLLSLIGLSILLDLMYEFKVSRFLGLLVVLLANLLTVVNAIPVVLAILLILVFKYRRQYGRLKDSFLSSWCINKRLNIVLSVLIVVLSFLFVQRYVLNVVEFHALSPACDRVNTVAQCRHNAIYIRDKTIINKSRPAHSPSSSLEYINTWVSLMRTRSFGIFGHKIISPTKLINWWSQILIVLGVVATIRMFQLGDKKIGVVLAIFIFYALVLYVNNYSAYRRTGIVGVAVQGRYLFPFLPILYIVGNHFLLRLLSRRYLQLAYIMTTLLVFISAGLPSYLAKTDRSWYTDKTINFNQQAHDLSLKLPGLRD